MRAPRNRTPRRPRRNQAVPAQRTEFGIDLGSANSLDGLRATWQRLTKSNKTLGALHPIVVVKERGTAMQLRLVAGPINDAATAAKLCAGMAAADYFCEATLYDGQRLSMPPPRSNRKRTSVILPPPEPEPTQPQVAAPPQQPHAALTVVARRALTDKPRLQPARVVLRREPQHN